MVRPAVRDVVSIRPATRALEFTNPPPVRRADPGVFYRDLFERHTIGGAGHSPLGQPRDDDTCSVQYHVLRDSIQRPFDFDWDT